MNSPYTEMTVWSRECLSGADHAAGHLLPAAPPAHAAGNANHGDSSKCCFSKSKMSQK